MSIGERIRARRQALGLTQVEVAQRNPNLDSNLISRWERGLNVPSAASMVELAEALESTPDELAEYSISLAERVRSLERRIAKLERGS